MRNLFFKSILCCLLLCLGVFLFFSYQSRPYQEVIGSFTTSLHGRTEAQKHNILRMAEKIDHVLLMPGEVFSFNEKMGPYLEEEGYLKERVFVEDQVEAEVGGGICQLSGTLYNAANLAGLEIIERHSHSQQTQSLPSSMDATVKWGSLDLMIKNAYLFPIQIRAYPHGQQLIVKILGKEKKQVTLLRQKGWGSFSKLLRLEKAQNRWIVNIQSVDSDERKSAHE